MKQYRFFTTKEDVDYYMGNKRDICCLEVEKLAESLRSYNHFIIAIEPDFTIHIFTYGGKHLVLKYDEIKKIKTGFSLPFYIVLGYILSITTIVSFLFISSMESLHLSVTSFFLICGALTVLFGYLLTKVFYHRKIKIKTIYHTTYSYTYACLSTFYSKKSIEISIFESRIQLMKKERIPVYNFSKK